MPRKKPTPVIVPKRIGRPPRRLQFNEEPVPLYNFIELKRKDGGFSPYPDKVKVSVRNNMFGNKNRAQIEICIGAEVVSKFLDIPTNTVLISYDPTKLIWLLKDAGKDQGWSLKMKSKSYYLITIITDEMPKLKERQRTEVKYDFHDGGLLIFMEEKDNG